MLKRISSKDRSIACRQCRMMAMQTASLADATVGAAGQRLPQGRYNDRDTLVILLSTPYTPVARPWHVVSASYDA